MPGAQGSIRVARKAKDGNDGLDAVNYWLVPSATQVKRKTDGTLYPAIVTCKKMKKTGNYASVESGEGTLKYSCAYLDGTVTGQMPYPTSGVSVTKEMSYIIFTWLLDSVEVATETVIVVDDGADGKDCFFLDLDNEMQGIVCDASGKPTGSGTLASCNASVYKGAALDSGWEFNGTPSGCTASVAKTTGVVTVTGIDQDRASVKVTAKKGSYELIATMSLYKVKPGSNGSSPVQYDLVVSASSISKSASGTLTPSTVSASRTKTVGTTTSVTTDGTLKYQREGVDSSATAIANDGAVTPTAATTAVLFFFYDGNGVLVDKERVPIVKDGKDGEDGEDGIGISSVTEYYAKSSSDTDAPSSDQWGATVPALDTTNRYLWNKETITYTNGSSETSDPRVIGVYGNDGRGISKIENFYLATSASSGVTTATSGWTATVQSVTAVNKYLWNYEKVTYTTGSTYTTAARIIGVYGDKGDKGDPAVTYELIPTLSQLNTDASRSRNPSTTVTAWKVTGGSRAKCTEGELSLTGYSASNVALFGTGVGDAEPTTKVRELTVNANSSYVSNQYCVRFDFSLKINSIIVATLSIPVIVDGIQGCIYRTTEWMAGIEYRNDSALETSDIRYIDVVLVKDSSIPTKARGYICRQTHTSTSANNPSVEFKALADKNVSTIESEHWIKMDNLAPILTPFLLADGALIKLLQSNQIVVMKDDGTTVNVALGGGEYPLWIGAADPNNANFKVGADGTAKMKNAEIEGKIIAGVLEGQRVELQPDNKSMKIYDSNGIEVSSFEGNSYTSIGSLFNSANGNFSIKSRTATEYGYNSGVTLGKGTASVSSSDNSESRLTTDITLSNAVNSSTPIEVTFSGYLQTYYSTYDYSSGSENGNRPAAPDMTDSPDVLPGASAYAQVLVETYKDSALKSLIGTAYLASVSSQNGGKAFSNVKAKTSAGGYHVLKLRLFLYSCGANMSANVKWGGAVSGKSDFSASYLSDCYVSRYFANGFCLGKSAADYIFAYDQGAGGMRFVMENNGYGIDVSNAGIKQKHHGGDWMSMPLLVYKGRAVYNSSNETYSAQSQRSFNGKFPTFTRPSQGVIRLTYPSEWTSALTMSEFYLIVNVCAYGAISGGSNHNKAAVKSITSTYIDIWLADDTSTNDGSVMIEIYTT